MSSQQPESDTTVAAAQPPAPSALTQNKKDHDKKDRGIGKLIRRITTKTDGRKRWSSLLPAKASATTAAVPEGDGGGKGTKDAKGRVGVVPKNPYEDVEGVEKVPKLKIFEERAQLLGQRFGLEIDLSGWQSTEGTVLRVEKPIRMRVRRTCHHCQATFGKERECPQCGHLRCSTCIRSPARRPEPERAATRERVQARLREIRESRANYIVPDPHPPKHLPPLTRPAKRPTQDLIYRRPRQRIRRTCHICSHLFHGSIKECEHCGHIRCTDCPRDPPKKDKYPYGYPGDVWGPTAVPYHKCHTCKTVFGGNAPDGTPCGTCGHEKCHQCPRMKPQKVEPLLDKDILARLQAKFTELTIEVKNA